MKILHITNMFPSESNPYYGIFVKNQLDSLKNKGIGIRMACIGKGFGGYRKIFRLKDDVLWADLVHCHFGHTGSLAIIFNIAKNKPLVVSYCGDDILGGVKRNGRYHLKGRVLSWINSYLSRYVDYAIAKSDTILRQLKTKQAKVVPNGVDTVLFRPIDQQAAREKIGLNNYKGKILFFLGQRENPVKNYALFKEATKFLGSDFKELFLENLDYQDVVYYLNASDVCILTSLHEGSSNALKEAMACNKPIVTVKAGDAERLIGDVNGCFIVDYDARVLAETIKKATSFKESQARKVIIEESLDLSSTADKIIGIYEKLLRES